MINPIQRMEKRITKTRFNMKKTSIKANNINPIQRTELRKPNTHNRKQKTLMQKACLKTSIGELKA